MTTNTAKQIPHGIADTSTNLAYLADTAGFITCLSIENGEVLARTDFSATPLTASGDLLIGWRLAPDESRRVRVFAAVRQGDLLLPKWEVNLPVPDWVEASSIDPDAFALDAEVQGETITASWQARSRYSGGAPPSREVEEQATRDARGTAQFDPETGAMRSESLTDQAPQPEQPFPAGMQPASYRAGTSWANSPWQVNDIEMFLASSTQDQGIVLVRRDSGGAGVPGEVRLTADPDADVALTPDGRYIFLHEPGSDSAEWQVFATEAGQRVSGIPFDPGTDAVAVVNEQVIYRVSEGNTEARRRMLRSRDLHTGELLWSHSLGEETRRAPPPLPQ